MSERRTFSRTPRKAMSAEERARLIAEMLGEEQTSAAPAPRAKPAAPIEAFDPFEALDALDAATVDEEEANREASPSLDAEDDFEDSLAALAEADIFDAHQEDVLNGAQTPPDDATHEPRAEVSHPIADSAPEQLREEDMPAPPKADSLPPLVLREEDEAAASRTVDDEPEALPSPPPTLSQAKLRSAYENAALHDHAVESADKWDMLEMIPLDIPHLEKNLVITASREEPAHGAFDVLRTRLVQTLLEHGWKRVAVTSPTRNCGKTFTSVNLAISLSRYESSRTILLDFDMRNPSVAGVIGDTQPGKMGDFLRGTVAPEDFLVRFEPNAFNIGPSLAIGTNDAIEPYAAELAQDPLTRKSLERMMDEMSPDIVIFDMPPALAFDDVIAFRPHFDGVLMVVGGGETKPEEVREVMRRLGDDVPLLGVVLNQAEGEDGSDYSYGY